MGKVARGLYLMLHPDKVRAEGASEDDVLEAQRAFIILEPAVAAFKNTIANRGWAMYPTPASVGSAAPQVGKPTGAYAAAQTPAPPTTAPPTSNIDTETNEAELANSLSRVHRYLAGYDTLPRMALQRLRGGWLVAVPFQLGLPTPVVNAFDPRAAGSAEASWVNALRQAVDSAYRFTRSSTYKGVLPHSVDDLLVWMDTINREEFPIAIPAAVYRTQIPSYVTGSTASRTAQMGWRRTLMSQLDVTQSNVLLCGGSGACRYPHKNTGTSICGALRSFGGWTNLQDGVVKGGTVETCSSPTGKGISSFRPRSA